MKIIAGKFKGRNLTYRERRGLRVTSQLVKEAMFGIIGDRVNNAAVLDLYCGYGSLGIEAISRGAKKVTFVDIDGQALKQLKFFLEKLEVLDQTELIKRDSIKVVKHLPSESYDVILIDAPYHVRIEEKTLEAISKCGTLTSEGICIVEHYSEYALPEKVGKLEKVKTRVYGDTSLTLYRHQNSSVSSETPTEEIPGAIPVTEDAVGAEESSDSVPENSSSSE